MTPRRWSAAALALGVAWAPAALAAGSPGTDAGTLALNLAPLVAGTVELRWEAPLSTRVAWAVMAGAGRGRTRSDLRGNMAEVGGQLRWYALGEFRRGLLLALDGTGLWTFGAGSRGETALALGPRVGYKIVGPVGLSAEAHAGLSWLRKSVDAAVPGTTAELTELQGVGALLLGWTW